MVNIFRFRFTPSVCSDEFEEMVKEKLQCYAEVVLVREMGEQGDHLHYHGRLSTDKDSRSVRNWCNYHLSLKGNQQLSVVAFDPNRAQEYHRYMAKGPISRRLSLPVVVVDQLGLLWETLHHAYHDQAVIAESKSRKRGRDGVPKPPTFMQELLALCRSKSVITLVDIVDEMINLLHHRLTAHDAFWGEKVAMAVFAHLNPDDHRDAYRSAMHARLNL